MDIYQTQSHQLAGIRGSYGIEHQIWATPRGPLVVQYAVTAPWPVPGNACASVRTIHETEQQARDVWGTRLPEPEPGVLWTDGGLTAAWECPERTERLALADDLASWAGREAVAEHDAFYAQADMQHGMYCCASARDDGERNMYAFAMELPIEALRQRHRQEGAQ